MDEIRAYFKLAKKYGFTRAMSSMLSVKGTNDEVIAYFDRFIQETHEYGLRVSLDVNTGFFSRLGQSYDDISLFARLGCDIVRLDGSYGAEHDAILVRNPYGIQIEMNASSHGVELELDYFVKEGIGADQVLTCRNFYPQRYTGLKWSNFLDKLRKYPFATAAFVSSHAPGAQGVWDARDSLPTVERLRDLPIDLQARILIATGGVDDVIIGNAFASEAEPDALAEIGAAPKSLEGSKIYEAILSYGPQRPKFGPCERLRVILEKDITPVERENLLELVPQLDNGDSSEWILALSERPFGQRRPSHSASATSR